MVRLIVEGFVKPGFEGVRKAFQKNLDSGLDKGGSFASYYCGELVVNLWGGYADEEVKRWWDGQTLSALFSLTKGVVAMVIAHMVDRDLLKYEDKVCQYWPEFAQNGKADITLAQFMSHQAGVPALDEEFTISMLRDNPAKLGRLLAAQPPMWPPGKSHGYHPITFGLYLDQLVRRCDPKLRSLSQYFQEEIAQPFGVEIYIGLPKPLQYRATRVCFMKKYNDYYSPADFKGDVTILKKTIKNPRDFSDARKINHPDNRELPSGSTHGHGTAASLAKLYGILANGGNYEGKQLLPEHIIQRFSVPLVRGVGRTWGFDSMLSLGFHNMGVVEGNEPPRFLFGHGGFGGQYSGADPKHKLSFVYTTNYCNPQSGVDKIPPRFSVLFHALYGCVREKEGLAQPWELHFTNSSLSQTGKSKL
ncbi:hypothetical protein ScPMuIL_004699 [Solemya velum]